MSERQGPSVVDRIKARMDSFTDAERRFARYVLATDDIVYRSITSVTEESGVGYGTIIRLCQKLSFSGFQDFKINLAMDRRLVAAARKPAGSKAAGMAAAAEVAKERIASTATSLDDKALTAAAKLIVKARRILAIGVGGSWPQAVEFAYRLARLGLDAYAVEDAHMQSVRASTLGAQDVLTAFSFSGSTREVNDAAALAKAAGAKVIAVSNFARSPLAESSEIVLAAGIWEEAMEAEIGSRLPMYFIVEALGDRVFSNMPGAEELLGMTAESVAAKQL